MLELETAPDIDEIPSTDISKSVVLSEVNDRQKLVASFEEKLKELRSFVESLRAKRALDKLTAISIESVVPNTLSFNPKACTEEPSLTNYHTALEDVQLQANHLVKEIFTTILSLGNATGDQLNPADCINDTFDTLNKINGHITAIDNITCAEVYQIILASIQDGKLSPETRQLIDENFDKFLSVGTLPLVNDFIYSLLTQSDDSLQLVGHLSRDINHVLLALNNKAVLFTSVIDGFVAGEFRARDLTFLSQPVTGLTFAKAITVPETECLDHVEITRRFADRVDVQSDIDKFDYATVLNKSKLKFGFAQSRQLAYRTRETLATLRLQTSDLNKLSPEVLQKLSQHPGVEESSKAFLELLYVLEVYTAVLHRIVSRIHYVVLSTTSAVITALKDYEVLVRVKSEHPELYDKITTNF